MKILLVAINSKFIHTNLAIYCLKAYAKEYANYIVLKEFTINNRTEYTLSQIYKEKPDVIAFSTYVWNIEVVEELIIELKKILPNTPIWLGGPEVSFDAKEKLIQYPELQGIMCGEGEATFRDIIKHYVEGNLPLTDITGISYWSGEEIIINRSRPLISLDSLPFPYENLEDFENKILYYESSRGCPFQCSYCLSSIERSVRFKSIPMVKNDLARFMNYKVKQVKFVDRTFNCNKEHALAIWHYLSETDNGVTNFHFEVSADLLDDDTIDFLQGVRPGLFQFEIGIQSTNYNTIKAIHRTMNLERLKTVVQRLNQNRNIHLHLDLIAGLPYENYDSFKKSFNEVYALQAEALQLGFLKVLKGSPIQKNKDVYGIQYRNKAPYEVLFTNDINYQEMLLLKSVESMVDIYYNSNHFLASIKYLLTFFETAYDFYNQLAQFYEKNSLNDVNHSRVMRYSILRRFSKEVVGIQEDFLDEALIYDLYSVEKLRKRPEWCEEDQATRTFLKGFNKRISDYKICHIERFQYNIIDFLQSGIIRKEEHVVLFDYEKRDLITNHAQNILISC